ncbi:hypothetical protein B0H63DRAFT_523398 [Podospora didyma]|uniref:WW domain-containing protein n=1 Tax=Podospora didyma TaxID=330526 RepID=A0AAE0NR07_9PEZI|nr:hypothetical protein B0H63DRAFT_523398 [Podospora didyma]
MGVAASSVSRDAKGNPEPYKLIKCNNHTTYKCECATQPFSWSARYLAERDLHFCRTSKWRVDQINFHNTTGFPYLTDHDELPLFWEMDYNWDANQRRVYYIDNNNLKTSYIDPRRPSDAQAPSYDLENQSTHAKEGRLHYAETPMSSTINYDFLPAAMFPSRTNLPCRGCTWYGAVLPQFADGHLYPRKADASPKDLMSQQKHAAMSAANESASPLLKLPWELRKMIFKTVAKTTSILPLAHACRQTYIEVTGYMIPFGAEALQQAAAAKTSKSNPVPKRPFFLESLTIHVDPTCDPKHNWLRFEARWLRKRNPDPSEQISASELPGLTPKQARDFIAERTMDTFFLETSEWVAPDMNSLLATRLLMQYRPRVLKIAFHGPRLRQPSGAKADFMAAMMTLWTKQHDVLLLIEQWPPNQNFRANLFDMHITLDDGNQCDQPADPIIPSNSGGIDTNPAPFWASKPSCPSSFPATSQAYHWEIILLAFLRLEGVACRCIIELDWAGMEPWILPNQSLHLLPKNTLARTPKLFSFTYSPKKAMRCSINRSLIPHPILPPADPNNTNPNPPTLEDLKRAQNQLSSGNIIVRNAAMLLWNVAAKLTYQRQWLYPLSHSAAVNHFLHTMPFFSLCEYSRQTDYIGKHNCPYPPNCRYRFFAPIIEKTWNFPHLRLTNPKTMNSTLPLSPGIKNLARHIAGLKPNGSNSFKHWDTSLHPARSEGMRRWALHVLAKLTRKRLARDRVHNERA